MAHKLCLFLGLWLLAAGAPAATNSSNDRVS